MSLLPAVLTDFVEVSVSATGDEAVCDADGSTVAATVMLSGFEDVLVTVLVTETEDETAGGVDGTIISLVDPTSATHNQNAI